MCYSEVKEKYEAHCELLLLSGGWYTEKQQIKWLSGFELMTSLLPWHQFVHLLAKVVLYLVSSFSHLNI